MKWSPSTPMLSARMGLGMVTLNGFVYAIGGTPGHDERYDPVSKIWYNITGMTTERYGHAVATDGQNIYAMGGFSSEIYDTIEMYNPEINTWQLLNARLTSARWALTAVFVTSIDSVSNTTKHLQDF